MPTERETRKVIDPITGKEYTVEMTPNAGGARVTVRDNEMGNTIQTGATTPNLTIALDEARQVEETQPRKADRDRGDDDERER